MIRRYSRLTCSLSGIAQCLWSMAALMADIVLFHSVLGLRQAEREIAAALEEHGHRVILPDLYGGERTDDFDEGFRLHDRIGQHALVERAKIALAAAPEAAVLAGVSFGAFLIGSL